MNQYFIREIVLLLRLGNINKDIQSPVMRYVAVGVLTLVQSTRTTARSGRQYIM